MRTYSWVWASTPGVTRTRTWGRLGAPGARRSSRSTSSKESTTMRPTPASRARASSASDLLLPCRTRRSGGTPAARATCSSPPVATSRCRPSSWASWAIGRAEEGLGGIGHALAEGGHRLCAAGPQVGLVVDEDRGAELGGQVEEVAAPDAQAAGRRPPSRCRAAAPAGAGSHLVGRAGPEQVQPDGQADPYGLDQPQAGLGQGGIDAVGHHVAVVVEAVEPRRPAPGPRS